MEPVDNSERRNEMIRCIGDKRKSKLETRAWAIKAFHAFQPHPNEDVDLMIFDTRERARRFVMHYANEPWEGTQKIVRVKIIEE